MKNQSEYDQAIQSRANYCLGIFYCNREDDRVLVPKRRGWGSTLNFARPISWVILGILLAPATVLPAIIYFVR